MSRQLAKKWLLFAGLPIIAAAYLYSQHSIALATNHLQYSGDTPGLVKKSKTGKLALPEQTNNVWQMEAIELPDTQGVQHTLKEWQGKVIMLNFWASWCAACQFEIPRFVRYQQQYAHQGLQIIGVGLDSAKKLANVERSLDMNYPTLVTDTDKGALIMKRWGNKQNIVPYTAVIAKDGTIVYIHRGAMEDEDFNEFVLPLL